ncbi:unnamed protein product [Closterium sp. NIES-53]
MRAALSSLTHGSTTCSLAYWRRCYLLSHSQPPAVSRMRSLQTAQALYDAVVACYSSPATAALGRLLLPYLFPELSAFATVEDLISHLRTSDDRYRAAAPAEFLDRNLPPMFITLYFIVTRLPNSLRSVRDHFLSLNPTFLTIDLLEQHLLAPETSVVTVGAAHGTSRRTFFEGCSPCPLDPSYASSAAVDIPGAEDVGAASASAKRRSSKGKGGRGGGGGSGGGGGGSSRGGGGSGGGGSGGSGGGSGGFGGGGGGSGGSGGSGSGGSGGGRTGAQRGGFGGGQRSGVAIFDVDYDVILAAMYALSVRAEGDCSLCVPPDPGIEGAAVGASESVLIGTTPTKALHTFTLDAGASRCFFRDSTTLTPFSTPVLVRLADPSGGPILARSSKVLPCLAVPSGSLSGLHLPSFSTNLVSTAALQDVMVSTTTPRGQRVSVCTRTRTDRHLATFTRRPGSILYTLATEPPQVAASAQVSASGRVAPPCSCHLLSHQTLLWHHRLGHPSPPRLRGMHSRLLVSGLPRSLPPLPPCLPCVEGRQRAAPHSSFPLTTAPLQTLHMDVWGPARVSGQGRECYFLLVIDDYTRYTMVFPLRSKGEVLGAPSSTSLTPPLLYPLPDQSQPPLQPASPLPAPSPYTEQTDSLTKRCELASHPASLVRTGRRVPRVVPLVSSAHTLWHFSDRARAASPTVVTDPSFESTAASALVAELLNFAAACRLDYATALIVERTSGVLLLLTRVASMLLAPEGDPDASDTPTPRSYAMAITGPYSSQWKAAMDAERALWKSTCTYVDIVPPSRTNIVDGMWIFKVKRPPGSPPAFKARYVARGFSQRQGVDYFQKFSPTPKMTTLRVLLSTSSSRELCCTP